MALLLHQVALLLGGDHVSENPTHIVEANRFLACSQQPVLSESDLPNVHLWGW